MSYDIIIYFTMKIDFFDKDIYSEIEENRAWKKYRKMSRIRVSFFFFFFNFILLFFFFYVFLIYFQNFINN